MRLKCCTDWQGGGEVLHKEGRDSLLALLSLTEQMPWVPRVRAVMPMIRGQQHCACRKKLVWGLLSLVLRGDLMLRVSTAYQLQKLKVGNKVPKNLVNENHHFF